MKYGSIPHHSGLERERIQLGFIPLTDCAPLVVAQEKGYFRNQGLDVVLSKETSWANIRDKLAIGVLDAAHLLAPMAIAASVGLGPFRRPVVTGLSLGLNGNAITVSDALYRRMVEIDPEGMAQRPLGAGPLRKLIEADRKAGRGPLNFATVFPYSSHNYLLRYWMAAAGIDPDTDLRLEVIPPPQMPAALEQGRIDGYCVGEPWNQAAVQAGSGRVLISGYEVWNNAPEKVLGVTEEWAEQNPATHLALITAILEASAWMDAPENRPEVAEIIARSTYINAPEAVVRMALLGRFPYAAGEAAVELPDFHLFHRCAANFPWRSHAIWYLTQMARWGQLAPTVEYRPLAEAVYRPEIFRAAAARLGIAAPAEDYKTEGFHDGPWQSGDGIALGADRFFDGGRFDPAEPGGYLAGQVVSAAQPERVVPLRSNLKR